MSDVRGLTIALNAGQTPAVLDFYTRVFLRGPDTAPMDDFLEWQICPGAWLQLSTGHERPGANNARVRFEVDDIAAAVTRMQQAQVPMGELVTVPQIVAFSNFSDHWGNALGFYQLLSARSIVTEAQRRRDARERVEDLEDVPGTAAPVPGEPAATDADRDPEGWASAIGPDPARPLDVPRGNASQTP